MSGSRSNKKGLTDPLKLVTHTKLHQLVVQSKYEMEWV